MKDLNIKIGDSLFQSYIRDDQKISINLESIQESKRIDPKSKLNDSERIEVYNYLCSLLVFIQELRNLIPNKKEPIYYKDKIISLEILIDKFRK